MDDAYRVSTRYFRIIVVCVWIVQGHTTYCTSFVSYTILRSNLRFSPCRSLDQFLHYEVVMVLLTAFERFSLPALSRQLNHYSAPFLTRQALFYLFLKDFLLDLSWLAYSLLFRVASVVIIGNLFLVVKGFYYFKLQYFLLLFSFYFLFYIYVCLFTFFLHLLTIFTPISLNLLAFSLHLPIHHHLYN